MKQLRKNIALYLGFLAVVTLGLYFLFNWRDDVPKINIIGLCLIVGGIALIFFLGRRKSKGISMINPLNSGGRGQLIINNMQLNAYTNDVKKANEVFGAVETERELAEGYEKIDHLLPYIIGGIAIIAGLIMYEWK